MLSFSAGRSVPTLHMFYGKLYTIDIVKQDDMKRKDVLLGVIESSRHDTVVLRNVDSGTSPLKSTLLADGDPLLILLTDGILRRLGAPVGKHIWTIVFTSYIPDNVGCYLGKNADLSHVSHRVYVTLHKKSTIVLARNDPKYRELVHNYYKIRQMKRLSFVKFGEQGRFFNEKGVFRALEIWTQTHAQGLAQVTDSISKTGTNRVEKKYKVKNQHFRSAVAYLEALETLISRSFTDDMSNGSTEYPDIGGLDESYFQ